MFTGIIMEYAFNFSFDEIVLVSQGSLTMIRVSS